MSIFDGWATFHNYLTKNLLISSCLFKTSCKKNRCLVGPSKCLSQKEGSHQASLNDWKQHVAGTITTPSRPEGVLALFVSSLQTKMLCFQRSTTFPAFSRPRSLVEKTWFTVKHVKRKEWRAAWVFYCLCEHILNWLIICVPGLTEVPLLPRRVRWCTLRRFWLFFSRDLLLTTEPSLISNQTAVWTCRLSYQQRWVTETCEPRVCALQRNRLCPSLRTSSTNCMGWWITWAN